MTSMCYLSIMAGNVIVAFVGSVTTDHLPLTSIHDLRKELARHTTTSSTRISGSADGASLNIYIFWKSCSCAGYANLSNTGGVKGVILGVSLRIFDRRFPLRCVSRTVGRSHVARYRYCWLLRYPVRKVRSHQYCR
ncbi:hypothetical protein EDD37DRAFT_158834 [Exophiala viscosa]|uniref:uncharacterized protein n=1 Tax=Exophiala viscosa TaxID=2486360 RepID=UPI0021A0707A|nr:hypothetical protein EDD37DRAFT_158834 [Exophiala viscosa]